MFRLIALRSQKATLAAVCERSLHEESGELGFDPTLRHMRHGPWEPISHYLLRLPSWDDADGNTSLVIPRLFSASNTIVVDAF